LGYLLQRNGPTAIAGERLQIAGTVAGCCEQASAIAAGRRHRAISVQGNCVHRPAEGNPIADFSCKML